MASSRSAKPAPKGATPSRKTVVGEPPATSTLSRRTRAKVSYKEEDEGASTSASEDNEDGYREPDEELEEEQSTPEEDEGDMDSEDLDAAPKSKRSKKPAQARNGTKRKRDSPQKSSKNKNKKSKGNDVDYSQDEDEENDSDESELAEGQTYAGKIHPAPKTGHVPNGQISRNTFKFLVNLQDPEKNDREWFKLREPAYRLAEKEWVAFVQTFVPRIIKLDSELPMLPPKDLIHRIYRDVRFSNDKTPYKRHFSASISRSGRKGIWAGYFFSVQPRNKSILAGGVWGPGKNELASIRHAIRQDSTPLKQILQEESFCRYYGPFEPTSKTRTNVFGHDDALKTAPKGTPKDHPEIDLLKLRSVAAVHTFPDEDVLSPDFIDKLLDAAAAIQPLVQYLNSVIALPAPAAE